MMYHFKKTGLTLSTLFIASCGGGNTANNVSNGELTGIWRSDLQNILYLITQNGNNVTINVCNEEEPFTLIKQGSLIQAGDDIVFNINNSSQLEFSPETLLSGITLNKINNANQYNSGSFSIRSSNIQNLETSSSVCAYRETDNIYNLIAAPYLDGYLLLTLGVDNQAAGEYMIPRDINLSIESSRLPGGEITANAGEVDVIEYSSNKLRANFTFTAAGGNEYSGSVNVNL